MLGSALGAAAFTGLVPSTTAAVGMNLVQSTDEGTILLRVQPAAYNDRTGLGAGDPSEKRWNLGLAPAVLFGGNSDQKDRPLFFGWNMGRGGGGYSLALAQEDPTLPHFGVMFEPFYNPSADLWQFEFYFSTMHAGGDPTLGHQRRPFMIVSQMPNLLGNFPPESGAYFRLESNQGLEIDLTFDNPGTLSTRTNNTDGIVTVTAAHNILTTTTKNLRWLIGGVYGRRLDVVIGAVSATTAGSTVAFSGGTGDNLPAQTSAIEIYDTDVYHFKQGTTNNGLDTMFEIPFGGGIVLKNNSRSLKALNSGGTPRDLMYWRSDDYLIIGDFGSPKIYLSGYVQTFGVALGYSTTDPMTDTAFKAISGTGTTPDNGAACIQYAGATAKICFRANGAWYSVAGAAE